MILRTRSISPDLFFRFSKLSFFGQATGHTLWPWNLFFLNWYDLCDYIKKRFFSFFEILIFDRFMVYFHVYFGACFGYYPTFYRCCWKWDRILRVVIDHPIPFVITPCSRGWKSREIIHVVFYLQKGHNSLVEYLYSTLNKHFNYET